MQLGMIGLGRMGNGLVRRLMNDGHECVVYDHNEPKVKELADLTARPARRRWPTSRRSSPSPARRGCMVPASVTGRTVMQLADEFEADDIIIDGGNSYYRDDIARASELAAKKHPLRRRRHQRRCVRARARVLPHDRRRGEGRAAPRPGLRHHRARRRRRAPHARAHRARPARRRRDTCTAGPNGAGHFVKMVHNGIEYGIMAAYAEGLAVLEKADIGTSRSRPRTPRPRRCEHPEFYQYDLDIPEVAEVWRRGSVVASWLLDLTALALHESPQLADFAGRVSDSGEGRWTVDGRDRRGRPRPRPHDVAVRALRSRGEADFADKLLSAMRKRVRRARRERAVG